MSLPNRLASHPAIDVALGLVLAAANVLVLVLQSHVHSVVGLTLALVETAPVMLWRRWPLASLTLTAGAALVAVPLDIPRAIVNFQAILFSLVVVARAHGPRVSVPATLIVMAGAIVVVHNSDVVTIGIYLLLIGAAGLLGHNMRMRLALVTALGKLAASTDRVREEEARRGAADERARLAREVHDVVAHSLSVIVVQAGAGRRVAAEAPEEARDALGSIERTGREALTEIRRVLGVLRSGDSKENGRSPQPSLTRLDALLEQYRGSGLHVEAHTEGSLAGLPATIDLSGFRIVQEALTNSLRHAGGARARVTVVRGDTDLLVEVVDEGGRPDPSTAGSGHGLAGMRERTAVYGGAFEAGPRPEGGWLVRARLPLR